MPELLAVAEEAVAPVKVKKSHKKKADTVVMSAADVRALQDRLQSLEAALQDRQTAAPNADMSEDFKKFLAGLSESQRLAVEKAQGAKQDNVQISVFNPLGERDHPRPLLADKNGKSRATYFNGLELNDYNYTTMTREEIEAFNAIHEDCECRDGDWTAIISKNGTSEVLKVETARALNNNDLRRQLPSMTAILYELKCKKKLPDVQSLFTKMFAQTADPDRFIENLKRLLEQSADISL